MPREIVKIRVSSDFPFEASAKFFAVLIEPTDARACEELALAVSHRQVLSMARDPQWRNEQQCWPPAYFLFDTKRAEILHTRAMRILDQERMIAAEWARALLHEAFAKYHGRDGLELWADGVKLGPMTTEQFNQWARSKQRQLAGRSDGPDEAAWKTVEQRAWRNTKPVLHLATAYLGIALGKTTAERGAAWASLFEDPRRTREFLDGAEGLRQLLLKIAPSRRLKYLEEDTIRVIAE
jgi:hypothetical protein